MRTTIPAVDIQRLGIASIGVGQVGIGPIHIGQLVLTDLEVNTTAASAELRNFSVTITHAISLDWRLHIDIPGHVIDDSGTEDLGDASFTCGFGNVSVPGLENLKIEIDTLTANNVEATAAPIGNLQLGAAVAEQIQARNVSLPAQGFTVAGLGIGSLTAAGFGAPAASLDSFAIGRLHGEAVPMGGMTLNNLALPAASIADIVAQGVDVTATPRGKAFHLDLGCLDITLKIKPTAEAHIDQLVISNPSASTSIGRIELQDVVAPYELLNLTLSQLGIESIQVPSVAVA